jgi:hypothetical protein
LLADFHVAGGGVRSTDLRFFFGEKVYGRTDVLSPEERGIPFPAKSLDQLSHNPQPEVGLQGWHGKVRVRIERGYTRFACDGFIPT